MPRPRIKKTVATLPRSSYTAQVAHVHALRVKELPHLTFYGKTAWDALNHLKAELERQSPQGYDLDFAPFEDRVFDLAIASLKEAESRH